MKTVIAAIVTAAFASFGSSCAPSTPQSRIHAQPGRFAMLPPAHQALVREGRLAHGMSPDAVGLAWGEPSRRYHGSKDGKSLDRWDYLGSRPVTISNFHGGQLPAWGPYGHRYPIHGLGSDIAYVPFREATVWFIEGRVDAWERME